MPLPKPEQGESRKAFIARCMSDPVMRKEFPDPAQRRAVCEKQAHASLGVLTLLADAPLTVTAAQGGEGGTEAAFLPRFSMVVYTGRPISVNYWDAPVIIDLAGLTPFTPTLPVRMNHDPSLGVGHTTKIAVEEGRLVAEGVVSRDTDEAREFLASAQLGFPWRASVGLKVLRYRFVQENESVTVNGAEWEGPLYVIEQSLLAEISVVDLGADRDSSVTPLAAAFFKEPTMPEPTVPLDQSLPAADTPAHVAATAAPAEPPPIDHHREAQRILAIREVCAGHPEIEAQAIREGWDVQKAALAVLRASRPQPPAVISGGDTPVTAEILEAACLQAAKYPEDRLQNDFDARILEAAHRRFRGRIGLQELLLEAAWANGYTGRSARETREILRCAFAPVQAGFSTVNIAGILSNVTNKFLLAGFYSVERTWRNICAVRNVPDFKTVTSYRLVGKDQYEIVGPSGELKHGTLDEEKYTNKAETYGLILTISRQDIINDDLGAITTVPRKLGRGSGLAINDVFWRTFMNNAAFFSAANNNYMAGADTALGIDGLTLAEILFMEQKDAEGKPIGVMPSILLVPPHLSALGAQLYKATDMRDPGATDPYPVSNPHAGKFRVEVSRYLSNTNYSGNSAKAWYLLAEPADLPVIEVAFLNGQESPTIETAEADFAVLGIQMRGYHDFGVALQDPKGGVKMKGEA